MPFLDLLWCQEQRLLPTRQLNNLWVLIGPLRVLPVLPELVLIKDHIPADDNLLFGGIPESVGLALSAVPHQDALEGLSLEFLPLFLRNMGIGSASKDSEMFQVRFLACKHLPRCHFVFQSTCRTPIPEVGCCHDCFSPELIIQPSMVEHASGHLHQGSVESLSSPILLWCVRGAELLFDALLLAKLLKMS